MSVYSKGSTPTVQEYELKLGIIHHPSLKTVQLIEFLQNESNEFLKNDLPQYIKAEQRFVAAMQNFQQLNPNSADEKLSEEHFEEFVGLLLIYSTSSEKSFEYLKQKIKNIQSLEGNDLFMIVVEMDNSQKQTNMVGDEGSRYCKQNSLEFIRLTLETSEDLINSINKNLYELVENYYYPNEEEEAANQQESPHQKKTDASSPDYAFSYSQNEGVIVASKHSPKKEEMRDMLNYASDLRRSREKEIIEEQSQIDASIENVENVLNNINARIKQKFDSRWFESMTQNLYSSAQKGSQNYSKIKLTQEFIDDEDQLPRKLTARNPASSRYSDLLGQSSKSFSLNFNMLKPNLSNNSRQIPLGKIAFFHSKNVIELECYENSTYEELAVLALRKFDLRQTERNLFLMTEKVKQRVEGFSRELHRAIKHHEEKKIQERTYLGAPRAAKTELVRLQC